MYQLSTEKRQDCALRARASLTSRYDTRDIVDLYAGITPELVPDFYGLRGDSSDNIQAFPRNWLRKPLR